jgi:hypothetical protein
MKLPLATLLLVAFNYAGQAQSGLIARYLLNNNANDSIGSNDGAVIGATPTTDRFNQANAAYNFNGSNSRIEFSAPPPLTQAVSWTISAWVKPSSFGQAGLAVYVGLDNGGSSDGFGFGLNGNSTLQGFAPAAAGFFSSGQAFPNTTEWVHVTMRRTNGIISFYMNGVKTPSDSTVNITLPTDFTIGSQNGLRFFPGSVDDVRIYNRALSTNEIVQVYAGNEGPCFPHAASATPVLFNGFVVAATIADGACGYTNPPTVTIVGGGGSGATATATISNGIVTGINITSAGCCYTNDPRIVISSPPFPSAVKIRVSRVIVTQHVMVGRQYVLEGSQDLFNWSAVAPPFTAQQEDVETEVAVGTYFFFRTRELP